MHFKCLCVQPANQPTDMTSERSARKHLKSPSQSIQLDIVYFFIACNCLGQNLYFVPFLQCVNVSTLKIFLISHNCNGKSCFGCYKCFRNWFGYVLRIAPRPPRHTHTHTSRCNVLTKYFSALTSFPNDKLIIFYF